MRLILEGERRLRLTPHGATLEIESADPDVHFSPLHMLAGSLATCTLAVLAGWAREAGIEIEELELTLAWEYVDEPYRVGRYDMAIRWPTLPENRTSAAQRVARHCTVEHTLTHPPDIEIGLA